MSKETQVWSGSPSQAVNTGAYIVLLTIPITADLLATPISFLIALCFYWTTKNKKYELTTQRLKIHAGVLFKGTNELELHRITDVQLYQSFWLKIFGLGDIVLTSTDRNSPWVLIKAVRNTHNLREQIRSLAEKQRESNLAKEFDLLYFNHN